MNDLGWTLAWLAAQVAVLLVPCLALHAMASRRGPSMGAWVATLGLGMVVILGGLAFLPGSGRSVEEGGTASSPSMERPPSIRAVSLEPGVGTAKKARPSAGLARPFDGVRLAWLGLERRVSGPVARARPWGKLVALAWLVGSGFGLLRLAVGLWAVGLCRRRGRRVGDPAMLELVEELRRAMGCRRGVEAREVPDLTTPATAGWFRPMLLLPGDWRGWDESERRAVIAHELAHVIRADYAAGLVARLAVVMNSYDPMVRWLAGRLHLEQELAADAMASRFAGGPSGYLMALSRLALKQEGKSPSWPARAFLPGRGTLIRRIEMLRDEDRTKRPGRPWSKAARLATGLGLLALTMGVASWKAPAVAQDLKIGAIDRPEGAAARRPAEAPGIAAPFVTDYVSDRMIGVVAVRPSALAHRMGPGGMETLLRIGLGGDLAMLAKRLGVDMTRPGFLKLGCEDIESVTSGLNFGKPSNQAKNEDGEALHSLEFGGVTVRTFAPFDWPAFFRQWKLDLEEVREAQGVYYKPKGPEATEVLMGCVVYQPDPRTIVIEGEEAVKGWIARGVPSGPAYLRGADWGRGGRDMIAVAFNNQGNALAKAYDLGRPDDKVVLRLVDGIDRWVIGVTDADAIALRAEAVGRDPKAAEAVARSVEALATLGLKTLSGLLAPEEDLPEAGMEARACRLYRGLLAGLKIETAGPSVALRVEGVGTLAELLEILKMEWEGEQAAAKAEEAKAAAKSDRR